MKYTPLEEAAAHLPDFVDRAVRFNEPIGIAGNEGNAVLLSEDEYDALMETAFILRSEQARRDLAAACAEKLDDCIDEEDADW